MKHIGKILVGIFLMGVVGCEPDFDFSDMAPNVSEGVEYVVPGNISMKVGKDSLITISGIDSCFVQIISGEGVVEINSRYVIGDRSFYGGITTLLQIHSLKEGVATCELYNMKHGYKSTIYIQVTGAYTFSPVNLEFPIAQESIVLTVSGPKPLYREIMNTFVVRSWYHVSLQNVDGYSREDTYELSHVGSTFIRYYNEDIDTLIRMEVIPTYRTYTELLLDYDDTRDSVNNKMALLHYYELGGEKFVVDDPNNGYELQVFYKDNGKVDHYTVDFQSDNIATYLGAGNDVSAEELRGFVEERYQKYQGNKYYRWSGVEGSTVHPVEIEIALDENNLGLTYTPYIYSSN